MDGGRCGRRRQEGDSGGGEPVVQLEEEHEHDDDGGEDALNAGVRPADGIDTPYLVVLIPGAVGLFG